DAVEMDVDEIEAGRGAPVSEQSRFDMLFRQWLLQERIVVEGDLPYREGVRRAPVGGDLLEPVGGESRGLSRTGRLGARFHIGVSRRFRHRCTPCFAGSRAMTEKDLGWIE